MSSTPDPLRQLSQTTSLPALPSLWPACPRQCLFNGQAIGTPNPPCLCYQKPNYRRFSPFAIPPRLTITVFLGTFALCIWTTQTRIATRQLHGPECQVQSNSAESIGRLCTSISRALPLCERRASVPCNPACLYQRDSQKPRSQ
jgi:hypothetical protein